MSDYTNAPATALVATHCAACGRPLLDAVSVETGMGPHCRKQHGFGVAQSPAVWDIAEAQARALGGDLELLADALGEVFACRSVEVRTGQRTGAEVSAVDRAGRPVYLQVEGDRVTASHDRDGAPRRDLEAFLAAGVCEAWALAETRATPWLSL